MMSQIIDNNLKIISQGFIDYGLGFWNFYNDGSRNAFKQDIDLCW